MARESKTLDAARIKFKKEWEDRIIEPLTPISIDPNKKNVLVFDKVQDGEFSHIYGAGKIIKQELMKDYNVFTIWLQIPQIDDAPNQFRANIHPRFFTYLKRQFEDENSIKTNIELMKPKFAALDELPKFEFAFILGNTDLVMPLNVYCSKSFDETLHDNMSEYFDYLGEDQSVIDKIHHINNEYFGDDETFTRRFSMYAIATYRFGATFRIFKHLYDQHKVKKFVSICTDPNLARNFFQYFEMPHDFYYYVDDNRGTREFKKLDVAQLQQVYTDRTLGASLDDWLDKELSVVFAGTVFHDKGPRRQVWELFLRDYQDEHARYFMPIKKNGIVKSKEKDAQIEAVKERFPELYEEVQNHISTRSFLEPSKLEIELNKFKFGLVFRCVSVYDSLNPKPYQYVHHDVLPLFDHMYDQSYLLIPKDIKDPLTIRNSDDIKRLVQMSEEDRIMYINKLKEHFDCNAYRSNADEKIKQQYDIIIQNL
jgi:hypothetical protein